ncbi:MAG: dihydropteroate synthase [Gammaproteobacteria bacterium]|nr:dihydropteroate synthase [Gammaproteobacteria bacterium]
MTGSPNLKTKDRSPLLQTGRAAIMGILNVTPDSFSDGGLFLGVDEAVDHAARMIDEGADIIDIGGESTRPGATPVNVDEEMRRVIPIIEGLVRRFDVAISIDTSKAMVMDAAVNAGATMINDVHALTEKDALSIAAELNVPVCLMHMQGQPGTMQLNPVYEDVTASIREYLSQRVTACIEAGLDIKNLILDPGFGFGKSQKQNFTLLNELQSVRSHGLPILAGLSRKSVIGQALGLAVDDRVSASIALALLAVRNGANIVRVHDVKATTEAIRIMEVVEKVGKESS